MKRKIFLICPVRAFLLPDGSPKPDKLLTTEEKSEKAAIKAYVAKLEADGAEVYWPVRDTVQTDPHGWTICCHNRGGMLDAHEVHVWYHFWHDKVKASIGSIQDFGTLWALIGLGFMKKVVIANPEAVKPQSHKDYRNVLLKLAEETTKLCALHDSIRKNAKHPSEL